MGERTNRNYTLPSAAECLRWAPYLPLTTTVYPLTCSLRSSSNSSDEARLARLCFRLRAAHERSRIQTYCESIADSAAVIVGQPKRFTDFHIPTKRTQERNDSAGSQTPCVWGD